MDGAPMNEVDYVRGHQPPGVVPEIHLEGKDAYPLIRKAMEKRVVYNAEPVRNEMYLHLGYYVTESSGHNSEYNWWFRKRPDLIEKYCTHGTNWNPGVYAYILHEYLRIDRTWKKEVKKWFDEGALDLNGATNMPRISSMRTRAGTL